MQNKKLLIGLFFVLITFTFNSCENEPIDSAINLDDIILPCEEPTSFQASNLINNNSVSLSWVAGDEENSWTIQYGLQGFTLGTGTSVNSNGTTHVISGLNASNSYSFYLRSNCDAENSSAWVGPVNLLGNINPTTCTNPSGLTAIRSTTTTTNVNLAWIAGGTETAWEIQYGTQGFTLGSGTITTSTTVSKQISNIAANTAYDFYVRAICSTTQSSSWFGPVSVSSVAVNTTYAYMNATVDGQTYTGMKPFYYPFAGIKAKLDIGSEPTNKILFIQGHTDALNPNSSNFVEITLKINELYWAPGTYVLNADNPADPDRVVTANLIIVNATNPYEVYEDEQQATLTIIEFNQTTKRIRGTFSFPYLIINNSNTTGPFQVTNGSFDFEIEDAVFN
ncbi:fibronectin type III domain-containing protein [Flavobacterium buctense]|uniref:Fibronectin type III domain-containing protein n=1 Tax=Flavobacterium buctense TaxID=1648146 RepID=A0ABU9E178_9FLAO|nr:fibronectin type III domain-containing protein [Flavobacterium buctense]